MTEWNSCNTIDASGNALIGFGDSPSVDAFGRGRISQPVTLFDSKLLYDKHPFVWSEAINNDGSSAFSTNNVLLTSGTSTDDYAIRQTKMRQDYQPGKSLLIYMTFVLNPEASVIKRVGYFNSTAVAPYDSGKDGIWLESDGTSVYVVMSRGGTETKVAQSSWNMDTMDGSGPSRKTLDFTKAQILVVDLEWLGVGRVRVGFNVDGVTSYVHAFRNANNTTLPYIDSPNHSLRYEVRNNGAQGTLRCICASVQSEGGYELRGTLYSADRGITNYTTGANTNRHPLISLRLKTGREDGTLITISTAILNTTASPSNFRWGLLLNPTVAGTDAAVWTSSSASSAVEYDITRNNTNTLSGGLLIASGYVRGTNQSGAQLNVPLQSALRPGVAIDGTKDTLVLAAQNTTASANTYLASIGWREPI